MPRRKSFWLRAQFRVPSFWNCQVSIIVLFSVTHPHIGAGIGNSTILKSLNITPVVDLPGVGENLQVGSSDTLHVGSEL